jgi:hypothetical protein
MTGMAVRERWAERAAGPRPHLQQSPWPAAPKRHGIHAGQRDAQRPVQQLVDAVAVSGNIAEFESRRALGGPVGHHSAAVSADQVGTNKVMGTVLSSSAVIQ